MEQIQTLMETGAQLRRSEPYRSLTDSQKIRRQLRIPEHGRSWFECRHAHQDHCCHQSALQQPQDCAEETVKAAESGLLHHPARDPGSDAEQEHDGKKNDEEAKNLS